MNRPYPTAPGTPLHEVHLANQQDLVCLRHDTRRIAAELGVDERRRRSLAAAVYEAGGLLVEHAERAHAVLAVGPGGDLEVVISAPRLPAADPAAALAAPLEALRHGVHRLSVAQTAGSFSIVLGAPLPPGGGQRHTPLAVPAADAPEPADPDPAAAENALLRRSLRRLEAEMQETNRGVIALYAELDAQAERVRQGEERMRILLDSVHDYAICMLGPDGEIVSWNSGAERLFGYTSDEIVGRNAACFYPASERDAGLPVEHLRLADGQGRFEYETLRVRRGGGTFDALVLLTAMRKLEGPLLGFALVVRDITERKRLETDLRRRADELASANRAKEDFLATLSHELRTPLNAMLGWTRLLRTGKLDAAAMARALETIERNARVQEQLIADILDVSRIVTGKLRIALRPLELEPIVDAALDAVRPAADAKGIRVRSDVSHPGTVMGDPDRLQQVVWNLVANAIKFTPPDGEISVSVRRAGGQAELKVSDTGEGIEASLLPYVFDRFTQGDVTPTRPHGGLGLGLSIVRHIVELHGGKVHAESEGRDRGATFIVRLPARAARVAGRPAGTGESDVRLDARPAAEPRGERRPA